MAQVSGKVDVAKSLEYLRLRVRVPRDTPLVAAREQRAHMGYAISYLSYSSLLFRHTELHKKAR